MDVGGRLELGPGERVGCADVDGDGVRGGEGGEDGARVEGGFSEGVG